MPKVSVVIPTYNRADYLQEAIDSVLAQAYTDYEIIVLDDGSTDNTKEALAHYKDKIKYFYQENRGPTAAKNSGMQKARGEYIAFLDDDDLWLPEKLAKQVEALDNNQKLAFVCSGSYVIDSSGQRIDEWKKVTQNQETFSNLYEANFVFTLTVMIRRKCLAATGLFDENLSIVQDYDLWLRLAKRYPFAYIALPLAQYRKHDSNVTKNIPQRLKEHLRIVNKKEIAGDLSFIKRRIRTAKVYILFAATYYAAKNFKKAGICYLNAVLTFPFIGNYYWPKEALSMRFSSIYRILKIYYMVAVCFLKNINAPCSRLLP